MHMNPSKRKLADHPEEWRWSAFRAAQGRTSVWFASIPSIDPVYANQVKPPALRTTKVLNHTKPGPPCSISYMLYVVTFDHLDGLVL
jgi:hypothetical protein